MRTAVSLAIVLAATNVAAYAAYNWMDLSNYHVAHQMFGRRARELTNGIVAAGPFAVILGYFIAVQFHADMARRLRQFSMRTMLLCVTSVATFIALWQAIPHEHPFAAPCVFFAACIFPTTSYGFDLSLRLRGAIIGAIIGASLALAVFMCSGQGVVRE
jgi:hypothetical protein